MTDKTDIKIKSIFWKRKKLIEKIIAVETSMKGQKVEIEELQHFVLAFNHM